MNLLLDTHVLLWWLKDPERLTQQAASAIRAPGNVVFYSAANIWEISIKSALGKLPVISRDEMENALAADEIRALPITPAHAWSVSDLPRHHGDPFDRILIAQARSESLRLVTRDPLMKPYDVEVVWA
jgi:PIN domain nuclease of toxin-antitoxin system